VKKSAVKSHRLLVEAALNKRTCHDWFRRFKSGNVDLEDKDVFAGRPKLTEDAELEALLDEDPRQAQKTCRIIGSCLINHFHAFNSIGNESKARKLGTEMSMK